MALGKKVIALGAALALLTPIIGIGGMIVMVGALSGASSSNSISACGASTSTGGVKTVSNGIPFTPLVQSGTASSMTAAQYFSQFSPAQQAQQKAYVALIIEIGRQEGFSSNSIAIALETAIQESNLRNVQPTDPHDRDSLGLFQQRPSVGSWGSQAQILDPTHATEAFYNALKTIPNRDSMPRIEAAIKVQIPNIADYYRTWKWDQVGNDLVAGQGLNTTTVACQQADGIAVLPLQPGYHVTATYGDVAVNYEGIKPHSGIDLSDYTTGGTLGRPVYAVMAGTVKTSGIGQGCSGNNIVTIQHTDGTATVYEHMNGNDITVHVGETVTAGEQIGKIGSCGQSTGPHLHFAVELGSGNASWLNQLRHIQQFGVTWLDPVGYLAHYGVNLTPGS